MRKATLIGNLGNNAEVKDLGNGRSVINFSIADSEKWKDKENNWKEKTTWIDCQWYMKSEGAAKMASYLTKGKKLYVEGKPDARAYLNKEGQPVAVNLMLVSNVLLLDSKNSTSQPANTASPASSAPMVDLSVSDDDDSLPF